MEIQLRHRRWRLGDPIGSGGFGGVYEATDAEGRRAALKMVQKAPGASRELLFVDLSNIPNVVPVLDSGETPDAFVIVMPRADMSLRERLTAVGGTLDVDEAVVVLRDICVALAGLDGSVVHRDLKPENVLLLGGHWCLADFGISRYAEATTAVDTRKFAMSPPYAAPERWRLERATAATDIYSVGVIAHELLGGTLPFPGPSADEYRDQHLHAIPPRVHVPTRLSSIVDECLYKAPETRPSAANLVARLDRAAAATRGGGLSRLAEANQEQVRRQAETARQASEARTDAERRDAVFAAGQQVMTQISDELRTKISDEAPTAEIRDEPKGGWTAILSDARLSFGVVEKVQSGALTTFDVLAATSITVVLPRNQRGYEGRSHSLWYCDAQEASRFAWFETAFMRMALAGQGVAANDPYALHPAQAAGAVGPGIAMEQIAWPFMRLDLGDLDDFIDRWTGWFADAASGRLQHPMSMPERDPSGSWRRA